MGLSALAKWLGIALAAALALGGLTWLIVDAEAARRSAPATAACAGNLRRIGQAVRLYAGDNDERLPCSAAGRGDLSGLLSGYTGQRGGVGIWRCPGQTPFAGGLWTSSYGYNWQYLLEPGPDYPHNDWNGFDNAGLKLSALARPANTLMFVDHRPPPGNPTANLWTYVVRPGQNIKDPYGLDGMGTVDFRHHRQANVLFCDGHVKAMGSEIAQPANEPGYWSPK